MASDFSSVFWYHGLGIKGIYAKKATKMKEMARSAKIFEFLYFKLVEISSEMSEKSLKTHNFG